MSEVAALRIDLGKTSCSVTRSPAGGQVGLRRGGHPAPAFALLRSRWSSEASW